MSDDLTTKTRIRDAAIERFPKDGFEGTTVRAIAADAGVSPGLILHHFGSKEGLHSACDDYVVRTMSEIKRAAAADRSYGDPDAIALAYEMVSHDLRYLTWTLSMGGDTAAHLFDEMVQDLATDLVEGQRLGVVNPIDDVPTQAAVLASMRMATLVLHEHLSRFLGVDVLTKEGLIALAPAALRLFSGELFNQEVLADAARAVDQLQSGETKDSDTK